MIGSAITEAGAVQNNRKFIGIEIDSDKFEITKVRISKMMKPML